MSTSMRSIQPDEHTVARIKNLAVVGTAIKQAYSEKNQDFGGDLLLAKTALKDFQEGILALELDPKSRKGMMNLIEYLEKKLDRRLNGGVDKPF